MNTAADDGQSSFGGVGLQDRPLKCILAVAWVIAWTALCVSHAWADELDDQPVESPFVLTFYWENDGTVAKPNNNTDRHYTNGVKATFAHRPDWAGKLASALMPGPVLKGGDPQAAVGYAFGHNIYTPDGIETVALLPEDRPYAGWLYVGAYLQRATENEFDHLELNVGMIGPSALGEDVQRIVHDFFDQAEPRGWDNQLGDEFGFNVTYQRKWKFVFFTDDHWSAELIPQAGLTLGTVNRHANISALVRVGTNLPGDFGPGRIEEPAAATADVRKDTGGVRVCPTGGQGRRAQYFSRRQ